MGAQWSHSAPAMNAEPARPTSRDRRHRGPAEPVAAGTQTEAAAVRTGQSIDSPSSPPESDPAGNINLAIPRDLHRELKTEASRQGLKLNEFVIPHLRLLVAKTIDEGGKA